MELSFEQESYFTFTQDAAEMVATYLQSIINQRGEGNGDTDKVEIDKCSEGCYVRIITKSGAELFVGLDNRDFDYASEVVTVQTLENHENL